MDNLSIQITKNDPEKIRLWNDILTTPIGNNPLSSYPMLIYQLLETCKDDHGLNTVHQIIRKKRWNDDKEFLFMLPEFFESRRQQLNDLIIQQIPTEVSDGIYHCSYCNSTDTIYREVQIRRADEPATVFIVCNNCGKTTRH